MDDTAVQQAVWQMRWHMSIERSATTMASIQVEKADALEEVARVQQKLELSQMRLRLLTSNSAGRVMHHVILRWQSRELIKVIQSWLRHMRSDAAAKKSMRRMAVKWTREGQLHAVQGWKENVATYKALQSAQRKMRRVASKLTKDGQLHAVQGWKENMSLDMTAETLNSVKAEKVQVTRRQRIAEMQLYTHHRMATMHSKLQIYVRCSLDMQMLRVFTQLRCNWQHSGFTNVKKKKKNGYHDDYLQMERLMQARAHAGISQLARLSSRYRLYRLALRAFSTNWQDDIKQVKVKASMQAKAARRARVKAKMVLVDDRTLDPGVDEMDILRKLMNARNREAFYVLEEVLLQRRMSSAFNTLLYARFDRQFAVKTKGLDDVMLDDVMLWQNQEQIRG